MDVEITIPITKMWKINPMLDWGNHPPRNKSVFTDKLTLISLLLTVEYWNRHTCNV